MKISKIVEYAEIVDTTTSRDDPYDTWTKRPMEKFIEELQKAGYKEEQIYNMTLEKEEGIIIDYNLFPKEQLKWDDKERKMKLKMKYTPLIEYKKALDDLGIIYDETYWGK